MEFLGLIDATLPTAATAAELARRGHAAPGARLLDLIRVGRGPHRPKDTRCKELRELFDIGGHAGLARPHRALDKLGEMVGTLGFDELVSKCRDAGLLPPALSDMSSVRIQQWLERCAVHDHALAHYAPFPVSMPVHLFEPRYPLAGDETPDKRREGWETVVQKGEVHFVQVEAKHASMMGDAAATLGRAVKRALHAASRAVADAGLDSKPLTPEAYYHPHIEVQRGTPHREPVVFIPGAGDNVATFVPFVNALEPSWPVHGLQPRGLDGVLVPHADVEAAVRMYLPTIEKLAAEAGGSVHLIGHSFGGWVAMELACQLQGRGRAPASLTLIDTEAPGSNRKLGQAYTFTEVVRNLVHAIENATGRSLGIDLHALRDADQAAQWQMLHQGMVDARIIRRHSTPRDLRGLVRTYGTALRTTYYPGVTYAGAARLALAAHCDNDNDNDGAASLHSHDETLQGWQRFAPLMMAWRCPGNHFTMLKAPYVDTLAQWWQSAWLDDSRPVTGPAWKGALSEARGKCEPLRADLESTQG